MTATRPPYQLELDLPMPGQGEAPRLDRQEVEAATATAEPESPASAEHLMEAICDPDNIDAALRAVVRNKGAPGIEGITVKQLPGILKARWSEIKDQLLQRRYQPQPERRVNIPKPAGGSCAGDHHGPGDARDLGGLGEHGDLDRPAGEDAALPEGGAIATGAGGAHHGAGAEGQELAQPGVALAADPGVAAFAGAGVLARGQPAPAAKVARYRTAGRRRRR